MSAIFVSYRRSGAKHAAYRLRDKLRHEFGDDQVFLDLDNIPAGARFADVIRDTIARARVVVVVIGPDWLDMRDADGRRRLDDPEDWVRQEVETALRANVEVIPVLVDGVNDIDATKLPATMRGLVDLNYAVLSPSETHWHFDTDRLMEAIARHGPTRKLRHTPSRLPLSSKAVWSIVLMVLVVFLGASEDIRDHETAVGGIAMAVLALVLAIWSLFDVQVGKVRGKKVAITGVVLGALGTLGMIGALEPQQAVPGGGMAGGPAAPHDVELDPNTLPPTASIPRARPSIDVSGPWTGSDDLSYRIEQNGSQVSFTEHARDGSVVAQGSGTITGNRIEYRFDSYDEGSGSGVMTVSDDGRSMVGRYTLASGATGTATLLR